MYWFRVRVCHTHGGRARSSQLLSGLLPATAEWVQDHWSGWKWGWMREMVPVFTYYRCASESVMKHVEIPLDEVWSQLNSSTVDESGLGDLYLLTASTACFATAVRLFGNWLTGRFYEKNDRRGQTL